MSQLGFELLSIHYYCWSVHAQDIYILCCFKFTMLHSDVYGGTILPGPELLSSPWFFLEISSLHSLIQYLHNSGQLYSVSCLFNLHFLTC
jgi:hypothetical protein